MRLFLIIFCLLITGISQAKSKDLPYKVYTSEGRVISFSKAVKALAEKQYIFFGEYHNNAVSHWLQLELTQRLYTLKNKKLVLGAEMFEADNQFILDEYLNGLISSKNYQQEMRLWPNYNTDYRPLVEFAKENQLKFVATNIPRRYANMVYKKGLKSLDQLSDLAKSYIVPLSTFEFDSTINCYEEMLKMPHGGIEMATAQAIKDATMAHFILKNSNPQTTFLHYNGSYHSDNYEGIIYYLKQKVESKKIGSITTVSQDDINALEAQHLKKSDFIICVKSNFTNTH